MMKSSKQLLILFLLFSTTGFSQNNLAVNELDVSPNYLITIIAGVLLAFGFQFLLTALSVALGVTAVGDLKKSYVENKYNIENDEDKDNAYDYDSGVPAGVKVTSALGIWNILTVAPSLFVGTILALKLTPVVSLEINIVLALIIWATFFMALFYLESRLVGTLIGGLINTAVAGLKASGNALKSAVMPSPQNQIQNVADSTIEKIRKEFSAEFDSDGIVRTLEKYASKAVNKIPNYDELKNDLKEIVETSSSNGSQGNGNSAAKWTAIQTAIQSAIESDTSSTTAKGKQKARQLKELLSNMKNAFQKGDNFQDSIGRVIKESPLSTNNSNNEYIGKIKEVLQNATPETLEMRTLKGRFDKILNNPVQAVGNLKESLNSLDRDTVVEVLDKNTALDKSQINEYAQRVNDVIVQAKEKINVSDRNLSLDNLINNFEQKVAGFIDGTDDNRLNYNLLKSDFKRAMDNPSESLAIVKRRLSTYDRDTLTSLITNTGLVDRSQINNVVESVESARSDIMNRIGEVETTAKSSLLNLERKAVIQAEHTRKTATSAAWWLVITIILSGGAAVAGAYTVL